MIGLQTPMVVATGAADVTTYFLLTDSTNHLPKTDTTITDLDLYYVESGTAISAKADVTALAAADSAHADNKAYQCGYGLYRVDWPDAAFDGGSGKKVTLIVDAPAGTDDAYMEVWLSPATGVAESVTGAVGSVTGAVGSVTGNVGGNIGGNVTGSVGSVVATVAANVTQILGTALTETAGYLAAGFKKFFNIATPVMTVASVNQTADVATVDGKADQIVAAVITNAAGTDIAADIIAVKADTAAILIDTGTDIPATLAAFASTADVADAVLDEVVSGHVGAGSLGQDIADILTDTGTTLDGIVDTLTTEMAKVPKSDAAVSWNATALAAIQAEANDALIANNLDHLCLTATGASDMTTELADNTILSRVIGNGDTSTFVPSTDGLHAAGVDLDAIHAKTTNLPASPAAVGSAMTLATDAVDAASLKTDAVTEIVHGLLDHDRTVHVTAHTVGLAINLLIKRFLHKSVQDGSGVNLYTEAGVLDGSLPWNEGTATRSNYTGTL